MSIAVSAIVKPSKWLLRAASGLCLALITAAGVVLFSLCGEYVDVTTMVFSSIAIICSLFALLHLLCTQSAYRLSITDVGEIRLAPWDDSAVASQHDAALVRMLDGSTLWPAAMIVHLRCEAGRVLVLRILPDSVTPQELRALSVAFRWIAAHGDRSLEG